MNKVSDLFILHNGNGFDLEDLSSDIADCNFISRTSQNNGVVAKTGKIVNKAPFPAGWITVALGGSVLSSFVQKKQFYTAYHVMALEPKIEMTINEKMYWCMCIKENAYRYGYGRQANKTLKNIELPDEIPNWVKNANIKAIHTNIKETNILINTANWKYFRLEELFDSFKKGTQQITESEKGDISLVSSSGINNGVVGKISTTSLIHANIITVATNGSVGSTFYHEEEVVGTTDVCFLTTKVKINKYIALFLTTILNVEKFKFSYGRKFGVEKIKEHRIKLPVDTKGNPDWEYMENYIKSLPYSDLV